MLLWTNPPEPDTHFIRFYAVREGTADTLKSEPYTFSGEDWTRSGPSLPDSCFFALPRGTYKIWCTATDTTGRNESGQSDSVNVVIE